MVQGTATRPTHEEQTLSMIALIKRFFKIRIIRYGLVGGLGIPINNLALFIFLLLMGQRLYPLANACTFIVSNIINFVLNQLFTYREQIRGIRGWEWIRRFFKGQLTSLSATLITYLVALALVYFFTANKYLANDIGIVLAFVYNFFISNKLVFRPTTTPFTPPMAESKVNAITVNVEPKVESTPK